MPEQLPDWERLLRAAARLQGILPDATLVGGTAILAALGPMDRLYPQAEDPGAVRHQLMRQLAMPRPYDLDTLDLAEYKSLVPQWRDWASVVGQCTRVGTLMANAVATQRTGWKDIEG